MEDVMYKRVLMGLLVVSVVAMWGSAAQAFNRINGVLIKHSDLTVEVDLQGVPAADTLVRIVLDLTVEIVCRNPQNMVVDPGTPEFQDVTLMNTARVTSADFTNGKFLLVVVFDLSATECHQNNFIKVPGSELARSVSATTAWLQCNGKEPGTDGITDGDACFEFGGTVETTRSRPIEVLQTECTSDVIRNDDGTFPSHELDCDSVVVS
jgi:hypothetical protein